MDSSAAILLSYEKCHFNGEMARGHTFFLLHYNRPRPNQDRSSVVIVSRLYFQAILHVEKQRSHRLFYVSSAGIDHYVIIVNM